jgi:hypothetical protein
MLGMTYFFDTTQSSRFNHNLLPQGEVRNWKMIQMVEHGCKIDRKRGEPAN